MSEMKAYLLICDYIEPEEGGMEIVHAESPSKAIMKSELLCVVDRYIDIKVRRAKEFDDKPLTDKTYIENGWWIERFGEVFSADQARDDGVILEFDQEGNLINLKAPQSCLEGDKDEKC